MRRKAMLALALVASLVDAADAQGRRRGGFGFQQFGDPNEFYTPPDFRGNHPYDGRFTFARIKYRGYSHMAQQGPGWAHDYPRSDSHIMMIMRELTSLRPFLREGNIFGGNILALDDPQLFKYPVAYMSEPGGWSPNAEEIAGMRGYFAKGGFVIFDDFSYGDSDLMNLAQVMQQVLPKAKILPLPKTHAIFDSFFKIDPDNMAFRGAYGPAQFLAIFEDNDPTKRVMAVINHNMDMGEAWEYSDEGFMPVSVSNDAYKLGVNYLIYALTH